MLKPALITDCGRMQTTKGRAGSGRWGRRGWEGPGDPPGGPKPGRQGAADRGSRHTGEAEGPDHRTRGARGLAPGVDSACQARGRELVKVHLPPPGPGVCERTREKTRGFAPWRHSWCDDPGPRGDWRAFRELWAGGTENWAERQTGAGSPAGRGLRKRDSGPCPP